MTCSNRLCELCGEGDGRGEAVVEFVDLRVETRGVEEAVGVLEQDLVHEDARTELKGYLSDPRQLGVEAEGVVLCS